MRDTSVARPEKDFTFIQTAKARSSSPEGLFNCSLGIRPDEDQSTIHVARRAPFSQLSYPRTKNWRAMPHPRQTHSQSGCGSAMLGEKPL